MRYINVILFLAMVTLLFGCVPMEKGALKSAQPAAQPAQPKPPAPEEKAAKIASLKVELPKTTFSQGEPIKLKFSFKANKFDLNLESINFTPEGILSQTVIKTSSGDIVLPKGRIEAKSAVERVGFGDSSFEVAPGVTIKAGQTIQVTVDNLLDYYNLKPGTYTLQTILKLNVYKYTYIKKSPRLLEIENEITSLERDRKLDPDAKRTAIQRLREEIRFLKSKNPDFEKVCVRMDSLMGRTPPIKSNTLSFTISASKSPHMPSEKIKKSETQPAKPPPSEAPERKAEIALLKVEIPKTTFSQGEPIKLKFTFRSNRSDLNLERLTPELMLSRTIIKTSSGDVVPPKRKLDREGPVESVRLDGRSVEVKPGVTLKAGETVEVTVDNLLDYYDLKPGTYTLQTVLRLNMYRSTYVEKSPYLIEIEDEIASLRRDPKLNPDAKKTAIQRLQEEIQFLKSENPDFEKVYVRMDSLMGRTPPIRSNVLSFTISG